MMLFFLFLGMKISAISNSMMIAKSKISCRMKEKLLRVMVLCLCFNKMLSFKEIKTQETRIKIFRKLTSY